MMNTTMQQKTTVAPRAVRTTPASRPAAGLPKPQPLQKIGPGMIRWAQLALGKITKTNIIPSGVPDAKTIQAVKHIQRRLRIQPDGRISPAFINRLRNILARMRKPLQQKQRVNTGRPLARPAPVNTATGTNAGVAKPSVCSTCGCSHSHCETLAGFAHNSTRLTPDHIKQIGILAQKIASLGINGVVGTGHTDTSGREQYNRRLGEKRAITVINALWEQLQKISPGLRNKLFFRFNTRGESKPVSPTAAGNRRVQVCLKKLSAA